ncbi:MAG: hypothetical protein ACYCX4_15970 [Bacillota bacterium]
MQKVGRTGKVLITLFIITLLMGLMALPALAEEESLPMKQLNYSVWPEYDTSDVLVIYSGNLVNNTGKPFSGQITYRMPKEATVNMVCELEKGMECQKFEIIKSQPDYDEVVWRVSRTIQPGEEFPVMFEYNATPFQAAGERNLNVSFNASFPVEQLSVEIKQPLRSSNFTVDPKPQSQSQTDDSLTSEKFNVFSYSYSNVKKDDKLNFNIKYTKGDNNPSVDKNTATPTAGGTTQQDGSTGKKIDSTVLVLVIAFIALLAVFIFYAMSSNRNQVPASRARKNQNQKQKAPSKPARPANSSMQKSKARVAQEVTGQSEKKKIRKMLLDGKISEETYQQLMSELDDE